MLCCHLLTVYLEIVALKNNFNIQKYFEPFCTPDNEWCYFHQQMDLDEIEDIESPAGNLKIVHFGVV